MKLDCVAQPDRESDSDETLMLRYRDGDSTAFEQLYARHKAPLYRYLARQCQSSALVDELFQDIWLKLINARERYTVSAKFSTYLYHLAHNRLIDYYRAQNKGGIPVSYHDAELAESDALSTPRHAQPDQISERQLQANRLLDALSQLPEAQRETFLLRAEVGLSVDEIASVNEINRETVKSRLRYAVAKLKSMLGDL